MIRGLGFHIPPTTLGRIRSASDLLISAAALAAATVVAIVLVSSAAGGDDHEFYFELFSGELGAAPNAMAPKLSAGPFPELSICYSVGALAINALNDLHHDRDFAGRCEPGPLLPMGEMTRRALELLRRAHQDAT